MNSARTVRRGVGHGVGVLSLVLAVFCAGQATAATEAQCRDLLIQALADKNPDTRKQAVIALSIVAGQFMPSLKEKLSDKDVDVRLAAVATLSDVKSQEAIAALRSALGDEVPEVAFAAAKALWTLHDAAGREVLLAILAGDSQTSSNFLVKQKREATRMFHTPRTLLLFAMNKSMGFVPLPAFGLGVQSMQAVLTDAGSSGRAAAALMLANDTDESSLEALRDALKDTEWRVRAAAVHALARRKDSRLKSEVAPLVDDENEVVRLTAAAAYLRRPGKR